MCIRDRKLCESLEMDFAGRSVAARLARRRGIIDTPIWDSISDTATVASQPGANRIDLDALTAMASPIARPGAPKEIADGVLYLASEMSSYVTGTELVIDGGWVTR